MIWSGNTIFHEVSFEKNAGFGKYHNSRKQSHITNQDKGYTKGKYCTVVTTESKSVQRIHVFA